MTRHKMAKPASASNAGPVSKIEQVCGPLNSRNTPSSGKLQAPPAAPDDRGESDSIFFSRRPGVDRRFRLAWDDEPMPGLQRNENVAFVSVRLVRDPAGLPATIIRAMIYGDWGRA